MAQRLDRRLSRSYISVNILNRQSPWCRPIIYLKDPNELWRQQTSMTGGSKALYPAAGRGCLTLPDPDPIIPSSSRRCLRAYHCHSCARDGTSSRASKGYCETDRRAHGVRTWELQGVFDSHEAPVRIRSFGSLCIVHRG